MREEPLLKLISVGLDEPHRLRCYVRAACLGGAVCMIDFVLDTSNPMAPPRIDEGRIPAREVRAMMPGESLQTMGRELSGLVRAANALAGEIAAAMDMRARVAAHARRERCVA